MPGVALHLVLADRVLTQWRRAGANVPFDPCDPLERNAFYHGAVGPDLGYFPGGHRPLSELAHGVRTGTLTRALLQSASTPRERAYAWGWLTHVLADRAIHPWIGHGVGELVTGSRRRFINGSTDFLAHLRVELGLDAWYAAQHPEVRGRRLVVAFRGAELDFIAKSFSTTYQVEIHRHHVERSHRAATRRAGQALATLGWVGVLMEGNPRGRLVPGIRRALRTAFGIRLLRSVSLAYLNPVRPRPWLLHRVAMEEERHVRAFLEHFQTGCRDLDDRHLDTGRILVDEGDRAVAIQALSLLSGLHGTPDPEDTHGPGWRRPGWEVTPEIVPAHRAAEA